MSQETSTAQPSLVFNRQDPSTPLLNITMSNITKLTNSNYIMWSRQVRALFEGHELHVFLDNNSAPATTILINGASAPNPLFTTWHRQDRLLYSAIIGAISLTVQPVVSTATTTAEVWSLLADTYGNPTRGHIRQLRYHIKACSKGTKSITEYLRLIKGKADELALLGKPMEKEELTEQVLAGLGEEYKPEIDAVNGRETAISFAELHERLLNREAMLLCDESAGSGSISAPPVTANAASARSNRNSQQHWRTGSNRSQHTNTTSSHFSGSNRSSRPYLGRCQACGTAGHSARYCPEFRMVRGTPSPAGSASSWSQPNTNWQMTNQWQPNNTWQPRANAAMLNGDSSTWLVDSGASHHMTSDLNNLAFHSPYNGGDEVMLGDGSGLSISQTGSRSEYGGTAPSRSTN